jgi:hypothetical protein
MADERADSGIREGGANRVVVWLGNDGLKGTLRENPMDVDDYRERSCQVDYRLGFFGSTKVRT